jgi:hypothetical protein
MVIRMNTRRSAVVIAAAAIAIGTGAAAAGPRAFTVWDNAAATWANPNAQDLADDTSPMRSEQSPTILPTFRKVEGAPMSSMSSVPRPLPVLAKPAPPAAKRAPAPPRYSARRTF